MKIPLILITFIIISCVYVEKCAPYVIKDKTTKEEIKENKE